MASKRFWDRLSPEEQGILREACAESQAYHRKVSREMEEDVVKELIAAGMEFNNIEPAERARMIKATAPVTEKYKAELGADLVNETLAEIEKVRAKQQ
jgi:TRAP-type C4-dicarboxylate transport system substrate-binding protein